MNAIGTQLHDPIKLGLTYGGFNKLMDAVVDLGRNAVSKRQIQRENVMSRLTRDGTLSNPSRKTTFSGSSGDREI